MHNADLFIPGNGTFYGENMKKKMAQASWNWHKNENTGFSQKGEIKC